MALWSGKLSKIEYLLQVLSLKKNEAFLRYSTHWSSHRTSKLSELLAKIEFLFVFLSEINFKRGLENLKIRNTIILTHLWHAFHLFPRYLSNCLYCIHI